MQDHEIEAAVEAAADLIRTTARRLARRPGFQRTDEDDLAQELSLRLLARLPSFDPERLPLDAFTRLVVARAARSLRRDRLARLRDGRSPASLHQVVPDAEEGPHELADDVSERRRDARLGTGRRADHERSDLEADVAAFLDSLPAGERALAEALAREGTLAGAARAAGVDRGTVRAALLRWRRRARRLGLRDYL